jgi:putative transposase
VAESFFQLIKRERIRRKIYATRAAARADVFNYIEMFYNPKRRHGFNEKLSPSILKSGILKGSRVSSKLVAIQT